MAPVIIVPGNNTVRSIGSHVWMALGLGAGLGLGVAAAMTRWPSLLALTQWLRPLGTLFLNLLSMVVIPLVATALFAGVAGLGDLRQVGRLGIRTLAFFWGTTLAAILIGLGVAALRSEEHTSELQSQSNIVCRLLLEKKKKKIYHHVH